MSLGKKSGACQKVEPGKKEWRVFLRGMPQCTLSRSASFSNINSLGPFLLKVYQKKKVQDFLRNNFAVTFLNEVDNLKASFSYFLDTVTFSFGVLFYKKLCYVRKIKLSITKIVN